MYELYFHKSPNTYKPAIMLEELTIEYQTRLVQVGRGEQFSPSFVEISPNSKVPVLIDNEPEGGGEPIVLFESCAILLYLADKHRRLIPSSPRGRADVLKWLFWHAASQSPMNGQCAHFRMFSPETTYAVERYSREVRRLMAVLENRLLQSPFVGGAEYSIADIACYPWLDKARLALGLESLDEFPSVAIWCKGISERPAIQRAVDRFERDEQGGTNLQEFAKNMFGHNAEQAERAARNARETINRMGLHLADDKN
ncbi:glutathione S-transferase N-terminal domain-containing protein [Rhizorhabdus argentea]|uniref:glutathione S-transferase N-terminal domain-containing protein n=1 Tax=Rhizorhabdus argentea TaxID=1387174 RepID=UPI0030EC322E